MEYYTYAYLREDGTPYYIGKGKSGRIYSANRTFKPPKDKNRIIFLKQKLTEQEAFKNERYMIAVFGRKDLGTGILYNRTDGGEGTSGVVKSDETKRKMSESLKGRTFSEQHRRNLSEALKGQKHINYGKTFSEEYRRKISEGQKGEKNHQYGKTFSEEHRRKISEASKNISEETRRKRSEAMNGKKWWNDGQISKMSVECPGDAWVSGRIMKTMKKFKSNE